MTQFNSDGHSEGDNEDRGNVSWSEVDWQHFLHRQEKEIAKFLRLYDECTAPQTERLDWVARNMGWESDDWSVTDMDDEDFAGEEWKGDAVFEQMDDEMLDDEPYTLHRHPVFIVNMGLFFQLRHLWRNSLQQYNGSANALLNWDFSDALGESERHALMAMQCMEMGDFMLCVVHLKRTIKSLNHSMHLLPSLFKRMPELDGLKHDLLQRIFDLREVALRVMRDCRGSDPRE